MGVAVHHFDLPDEAPQRQYRKPFLIALRGASTPTRATPARVGDPGAARRPAAQGRVYLLSLPSIYEPVCTQKPRPHWLDMLGYYLSPLPGLVPRQSKGLTRTFNYTLEGRLSEAAISGVRMQ